MQFLNYTYKQLYLLTGLLILFILLLFYRNNVTPTWGLYKECSQMEIQLQKAENANIKLQTLKNEYRKLNKLAGNSKLSHEEIHQAILSNSNLYSSGANVNSMREVHFFNAEKMEVVTHLLDMHGNFNDLVQLAYKFETSFHDARLSSLKIFSIQDSRTKKLSLYGTYYFQHFKK